LTNTIQDFSETVKIPVTLKAIDPLHPFDRAFFTRVTEKGIHLSLNQMGSGYEMIFSLLYLLSSIEETNREEIILIDEPELHLHPDLQEKFVQVLLKLAKVAQIVITTHSPLLLKQIFIHCPVNAKVLRMENNKVQSTAIKERILPYISANEVNYLAFDLITIEYFNELYGHLMEQLNIFVQPSFEKYLHEHYQVALNKKWMNCKDSKEYSCSLLTYIRNSIHHPENTHNEKYSQEELRAATEEIRDILKQYPQRKDI
jgi:ABC-type multidrug transport system ATPase subunit